MEGLGAIYNIAEKHKELDIPEEYKKLDLHIALERADSRKDEETFIKLFKLAPTLLRNHIKMTEPIFGKYNFHNKINNKITVDEAINFLIECCSQDLFPNDDRHKNIYSDFELISTTTMLFFPTYDDLTEMSRTLGLYQGIFNYIEIMEKIECNEKFDTNYKKAVDEYKQEFKKAILRGEIMEWIEYHYEKNKRYTGYYKFFKAKKNDYKLLSKRLHLIS